jgi:hypothetical protein
VEKGITTYRDVPDNNGNVATRETNLSIYFKKQIEQTLKQTKKSFIYTNHIEELEQLVEKAGILGYLKQGTPSNIITDYLIKNKVFGFDKHFELENKKSILIKNP